MKIIDCFLFFNEFDLLEIRLKMLDPQVDHFVLVESDRTNTGIAKPYYYKESEARFARWKHKIIHVPIRQDVSALEFTPRSEYDPESAENELEKEQRNALVKGVQDMAETDLVLLSDVDEIPHPGWIKKISGQETPLAFSLLFHYYFLNGLHRGEGRWWKGCIASTVKQFREITPQGLRNNRDVYPSIPQAGWHFSFLGGIEKIKEKIGAFSHSEYNKDEFTNEKNIGEALLKGGDIFKRKGITIKYMPLSYYPAQLQKLMKQYPHLLNLPGNNPVRDAYYALRRLLKSQW